MPHTQMIEERLKFLKIDAETTREIQAAKKYIEPAMDGMLDRFYDHLLGQPELEKLFVDGDAIARARAGQKYHWLNSLFNGEYDNTFFERAQQIGRAHAQVGLTINWYIGGYCQMFGQIIELITENHSGDRKSIARLLEALSKVVFLDIDLVIHCYLEAKDSAIRQILHRATDFRADVATLSNELTETTTHMQVAVKAMSTETRRRPEVAGHNLDVSMTATSDNISGNKESDNEIFLLVERLSQETAQLSKRLDDLQFGDRLYIVDDVARPGIFAHLKAILFGKH